MKSTLKNNEKKNSPRHRENNNFVARVLLIFCIAVVQEARAQLQIDISKIKITWGVRRPTCFGSRINDDRKHHDLSDTLRGGQNV